MMRRRKNQREGRAMKMNDVTRGLLNNWPIKVLSLFLAVLIYTIIHFTSLVTREVEIPLRVIHPEHYTAVSTVPQQVTLILKGDDEDMSALKTEAVDAVADFSAVDGEGVHERPITLLYDNELFDIDFSASSDPSVLKIYYETIEGGGSQ